jgi:hypothetical protein
MFVVKLPIFRPSNLPFFQSLQNCKKIVGLFSPVFRGATSIIEPGSGQLVPTTVAASASSQPTKGGSSSMNADQLFIRPRSPISGQPPVSSSSAHHPRSTVHRQSPTFNFQPSNLQPKVFVPHPTAFVPQTTNVESPAITRNSPRIQPSKSQESDLFLDKEIFKLFLLKNPPSAG